MIQLKEALIGKKNAKDAKVGVNDKNVIWVLKSHNTYIDIYLMKHGVKTAKTKDGITLYILTNGQLSQYWKNIEIYDSVTMVVKDPSMSMKEVENYIKSHEYKYRSFNDAFSFEDFNEFISESLIGRHNEKSFFGTVVYCMAVARNDIQSEILNDRDTEYYTWDEWGVLFIPNNRIQYWIDYCKKEMPRIGWWAGKIHASTRNEAKKILLRCKGDLEAVIEKIDGPSVI